MFCSKCGAELRDGALFCDKCGASVSGVTNPEQVPKKRSRVGIIILAIVLALVIAACGIGAFIFFSKDSGTAEADLKIKSTGEDKELQQRLSDENENVANDYFVLIEDDADSLTANEEEALKQAMVPVTKYGNAVFVTIDDNSSTTSSFAEKRYRELMDKDSGALFVIDMDNREIYLFMDGEIYNKIGNDGANKITDKVYRYATKAHYYSCAEEVFKLILDKLEK